MRPAAGYRLARFNITSDGSRVFKGLPVPAAALMVSAVWLLWGSTEQSEKVIPLFLNIYFVYGFLAVMVILMVSKIRMLSLKFAGFSLSENINQYIIIVVSILLLIFFRTDGILYSLVFYLLYSLVMNFFPSTEG